VDERVRAGVTLVLGEVEADVSARDGDELREPRLELVLPLLVEAEWPVPLDRPGGVVDVQDRNDLFFHASLSLSAQSLP